MSTISLAFDRPDLAEHYEQISAERQFKFGQQLIADLGVAPGERVLDIGCGTGLLARHTAEAVGPGGAVIGIDPLPLRIELAQKKAQPNLRFQVGNAYDLGDFLASSFAVFHWLPDKHAPLREIFRVLKPGGRVGIATGSKEHPGQIQPAKQRVLSRAPYSDYPAARSGASHPVTADELRALLEEAGFAVESLAIRPKSTFLPTAGAAIDFSEASSFGNLLGHLPESLRVTARREIEAELELLRTPDGIPQGGANLVVIARKP
jgi:ubiquinone/menaquinone biosynthesis C-methylase UbiE